MSHNPRTPKSVFTPHPHWNQPKPEKETPSLFVVEKKASLAKPGNNGLHIVFILDESTSMKPQRTNVIAGFNEFVETQKKVDAKAWMTVLKFDGYKISVLVAGAPIHEVKPLTLETYSPAGSTNLLDAVGEGISIANDKLFENSEEKRESVLLVISTDGEENVSTKYTKSDIKKLIDDGKEKGWGFMFIGADFDAFGEAGGIGIATGATLQTSGAKIREAYAITGAKLAETRGMMSAGVSTLSADLYKSGGYFSDAERDQLR